MLWRRRFCEYWRPWASFKTTSPYCLEQSFFAPPCPGTRFLRVPNSWIDGRHWQKLASWMGRWWGTGSWTFRGPPALEFLIQRSCVVRSRSLSVSSEASWINKCNLFTPVRTLPRNLLEGHKQRMKSWISSPLADVECKCQWKSLVDRRSGSWGIHSNDVLPLSLR